MKKHLLCLTIDTDPDGLSGKATNRQTLEWKGLDHIRTLPEKLAAWSSLGSIPITWFVRADGQIESILGSTNYLFEKYEGFWSRVAKLGHELAWHPHLYRQARREETAVMITDPIEARDELERLWGQIKNSFHATAFRNGEGWHSPETYAVIESLGFRCDSTCIPGRKGIVGHPMDWDGAPNAPYFPASEDLRARGPERAMLELPMNTWLLQAPYDAAPRIRYMNPAVHPNLFAKALQNWENACKQLCSDFHVWVMIFHPDEVLPTAGDDRLYARSMSDLCHNLTSVTESLKRLEHEFEWATVSTAAERWKDSAKVTA